MLVAGIPEAEPKVRTGNPVVWWHERHIRWQAPSKKIFGRDPTERSTEIAKKNLNGL